MSGRVLESRNIETSGLHDAGSLRQVASIRTRAVLRVIVEERHPCLGCRAPCDAGRLARGILLIITQQQWPSIARDVARLRCVSRHTTPA